MGRRERKETFNKYTFPAYFLSVYVYRRHYRARGTKVNNSTNYNINVVGRIMPS